MSVQLRNPELVRLLAADFVTRREVVATAGNRLTLTSTDLTVSGGGSLTLSAAGSYTLTVPATGTAALLGTANVFTANQTIEKSTPLLMLNNTVTSAYGGVRFQEASTTVGTVQLIGSLFSTTGRRGNFEFFNNTSTGSITFHTNNSVTPKLTITLGGHLLVDTTTDDAQLSVSQASTTAAIPTLRLKQADLSEEFIRFDTTVGSGNPINTTALGAYYGRLRVYVEGVGAKWIALYD